MRIHHTKKPAESTQARMYRHLLLALLLTLLMMPLAFAADEIDADLGPAPGSYRITAEDGEVRFGFELFRGDIRFDGRLSGRPVRMLIDNGYLWDQILFFGSPRVDSLNLNYDGVIDVGGSGEGDQVSSRTASSIKISFPGVEFYDQTAIVTPYSSGLSNMWWGCEGQVSATFLKHFVVSFNFDRMEMTLTEPDKFEYRGSGAEIPMTHLGQGAWAIPAVLTLDDGRKIALDLAMDLGTGDQLEFSTTGPNTITPPEASLPGSLGFGIQGETLGSFGRIKSVRIGDYDIPEVVSGFVSEEYGGHTTHEATIGLGLLSRFNFIYDYPHHRMFIEPNNSFDQPFEYNMSGMDMKKGKGDFLSIMRVHPNSPAADAGLKPGDKVISIDGRPAIDYDVWELRPLLRCDGARVKLSVQRQGSETEEEIILTLRRLI